VTKHSRELASLVPQQNSKSSERGRHKGGDGGRIRGKPIIKANQPPHLPFRLDLMPVAVVALPPVSCQQQI